MLIARSEYRSGIGAVNILEAWILLLWDLLSVIGRTLNFFVVNCDDSLSARALIKESL